MTGLAWETSVDPLDPSVRLMPEDFNPVSAAP